MHRFNRHAYREYLVQTLYISAPVIYPGPYNVPYLQGFGNLIWFLCRIMAICMKPGHSLVPRSSSSYRAEPKFQVSVICPVKTFTPTTLHHHFWYTQVWQRKD